MNGLSGFFFFVNDTATTEIYTLSLHDARPICQVGRLGRRGQRMAHGREDGEHGLDRRLPLVAEDVSERALDAHQRRDRSEEHTSELQSRQYLVCRLLLEKKKKIQLLTYSGSQP